MEINKQKYCPKCKKNYQEEATAHYLAQCSYLQLVKVAKVSDKVVRFQDDTFICLRCFKQFENSKTWYYHRKKISSLCLGFNNEQKKFQTPEKQTPNAQSHHGRSELINSLTPARQIGEKSTLLSNNVSGSVLLPSVTRKTFINTSLFNEPFGTEQKISVTKVLTKEQQTTLMLLDNFASRCKIHLIEWVNKHYRIKRQYLQLFFESFTDRLIKKLQEQIKTPTFELLQLHLKYNWKKILEDPSDIFDQDEINKKVQDLPPTTRMKILRSLNSIYEQDYKNIFPKFTLDYKPQTSRQHLPLKTTDFFQVLQQLFRTKQRTLVHIAIDFYLMFQSGQRLKSDRENIQQGIRQLLRFRKQQPQLCQFEMKINKTARFNKNKKTKFILSEQLCQLLQHFGWVEFYKKGRLYERMNKIFGFSIYSIKKCLFSEVHLKGQQLLRPNLKKLADHKSEKMAMIYAKSGEEARIKILKDNLKVPNLVFSTIRREQLHGYLLAEYPTGQRYAEVNKTWLQELKRILGYYNKQKVDFYDWNGSDFQQFSPPSLDQKDNSVPKNQIQSSLQFMKEYSVNSEEKQLVQIYEQPYHLSNGKFDLSQAYLQSLISYCYACQLYSPDKIAAQLNQAGVYCKYCFAQYHLKCIPAFCSCLDPKIDIHNAISYTNSEAQVNCDVIIKMPEQYFNKNAQKLQQIKFLLTARRFYYTSSAVCLGGTNFQPAKNNIKNYKLVKLHLPNFQLYQKNQYFPPLQLRISGNQTTSGKGFGLFASDQIGKNCFIGEYAADILTDQQAILIRRPDSVMTLVPGSRPANNIVVGPVKHCGYVLLINGSSQSEANCKMLTAQVNGFIRLILYTIKVIKKGTQLCYNYSQNSEYTKKTLNSYKIDKNYKIIKEQTSNDLSNNQRLQKCGLTNLGQTCYMNSVFQFLRLTIYPQYVEEKEKPINIIFQNIMKKMDNKSTYSPNTQVNFISQFSKQRFNIGRQHDAQEFLTFLLDNLGDSVLQKCSGSVLVQVHCKQCQQFSQIKERFLDYIIDLSKETEDIVFSKKSFEVSDYDCATCKKRVVAKRTEEIIHFPTVLFICLKRFDNHLLKDERFFNNFTFQKYGYKLKAIISHIGSLIDKGHYVTYEICSPTEMITYDDSIIRQNKYNYQQAYILGYSKT